MAVTELPHRPLHSCHAPHSPHCIQLPRSKNNPTKSNARPDTPPHPHHKSKSKTNTPPPAPESAPSTKIRCRFRIPMGGPRINPRTSSFHRHLALPQRTPPNPRKENPRLVTKSLSSKQRNETPECGEAESEEQERRGGGGHRAGGGAGKQAGTVRNAAGAAAAEGNSKQQTTQPPPVYPRT